MVGATVTQWLFLEYLVPQTESKAFLVPTPRGRSNCPVVRLRKLLEFLYRRRNPGVETFVQ